MEKVAPGDEPPEYDRVEPGYHRDLPREERQEWGSLVADHTGKLPAEWVNDVLKEAEDDGLRPA